MKRLSDEETLRWYASLLDESNEQKASTEDVKGGYDTNPSKAYRQGRDDQIAVAALHAERQMVTRAR